MNANSKEEPVVSSFVLLHGSWHGAWCWYKVAPRLRALGHEVIVPELPSHGHDRTPPAEVDMDDYVGAVVDAIDRAAQPVVLVGHSRGGIAISQAAEVRAAQLRTLVYLAAYLLRDGETVLDWAPSDSGSLVVPNLDVAEDHSWDMLREAAFDAALYADCSAQDIALAHLLLTPEPLAPSLTPLRLTPERYGRVPRAYIELTQDRTVTPALQRRMRDATPCARVVALPASHSAYFSMPDALVSRLIELALDPELEPAEPVLAA
jgi:pimeloyl-ACP methyl ester carboxylesterase